MSRVVDVVDHEDGDEVDSDDDGQQNVEKVSSVVQFLVVSVLPEEINLEGNDCH